jgi:hypothetical protein
MMRWLMKSWVAGALLILGALSAADVQVRTTDGQTLQGEYLSTEDGLVRLRTRYGIVQIPSKDIVTLSAAQGPVPIAPIDPVDPAGPVGPDAPVAGGLQNPNIGTGSRNIKTIDDVAALSFPPVKRPDIKALLAARAGNTFLQQPNKSDRQELNRLARNFGDSSNRSRDAIVRDLRGYGTLAYPFIAGNYTHPTEVFIRAELLHALAVPGRPLSAGIFSDALQAADAVYDATIKTPPPPPPEYLSKRDRERFASGVSAAEQTAAMVLDIEQSASIAGGPLNAMLLLERYESRYDAPLSDALLWNAARDRERLGATANDAAKPRGTWSGADKILLAEQAFPLLFRADDNQKVLPRDLLKKILPSGYPKWDAAEYEWVEWWTGAKKKLLK